MKHGTLAEHRKTSGTNNGILAEQSKHHGIVEHVKSIAAKQCSNKATPRNTANTERRYIEQMA